MRSTLISGVLLCAALAAPAARGEEAWTETTDIVRHPYSTEFAAGGSLRLDVRSGDVHIVGTNEPRISVALSGWNAHTDSARKVKVRFRKYGSDGEMKISGGPKGDLTITIRIPAETDLYARVPFGDVDVRKVLGDKDVELHAGDLIVDVGDPGEYARVDCSVTAGDLDGGPFDEYHDGLFTSFRLERKGRYRLHAHVGAGDLTLESSPREDASLK